MNDWIHIRSRFLEDIIKQYQLPVNQIIKTKDELLLRPYLFDIRKESNYKQRYSQNKVDLLVELMIVTISHAFISSQEINSETKRTQYMKFHNLRNSIIKNKQYYYTVSDMADYMELSVSRFNTLYKNIFNISPKEDMLNIKIEDAKLKLINTSQKLHVIANECGFNNEYYFSRIFCKKVGVPPNGFRQNLGISTSKT